jgi:carbonic anhydrase
MKKFDRNQLEEKLRQWRNLKFYFPYRNLSNKPKFRLAIITCMDCRIISNVFGIEDPGEAIVIRNAGALMTPDSLRSLLIAIYELNVNKILVCGHTDCGCQMNIDQMNDILSKISERTNLSSNDILHEFNVQNAPQIFYGFLDVKKQVLETVKNLQQHPLIPSEVEVLGYIYETLTGDLNKLI